MRPGRRHHPWSFEAGARGYVTKSEANEHLLMAVEALAARRPYVSEHIQVRLAHCFNSGARQTDHLSPGARVILQLVSDNYTDQDIAALLGVSPQLIENFRSQLMRRHS